MPSRRKRKRERREAEATAACKNRKTRKRYRKNAEATAPPIRGDWGARSDIRLAISAIHQGADISEPMCRTLVGLAFEVLSDPQLRFPAVDMILAMEAANQTSDLSATEDAI